MSRRVHSLLLYGDYISGANEVPSVAVCCF